MPHDFVPILIMLIIFGMPVAIVAIISITRSRNNAELQKTLRMSIEKGQPLPPEFIDSLQRAVPKAKNPMNDVRAGVILIAIALAIVVWNFLDNDFVIDEISGFAAVPGFIGIALLVLGIIGLRSRNTH